MGKDARRHFESLYVFCDGFSSVGEAMATVETFGFSSSSFLYLCFCEMWYPITVNSYYSRLVITKEKVYLTTRPFTVPDVADTASFNPSSAVLTSVPQQDDKKWQDGMCRDMQMIDKDMHLMRADGARIPENRILWNNTVISFALNFFVREIRIATDKYGRGYGRATIMEPASTKVLRDEIADIDAQIIDLLATRMDITDELAKAKKASGQSAWDDDVEKRIVNRYNELCQEVNLTKEEADQIARLILSISKERQMRIYNE